MPTYIRPARVVITEGGAGFGGLVLIAAGLAATAALVAFVAAHLVLLAVCAVVFVVVMGGVAAWFRWAASPARLRQEHSPRPPVRVIAGRPERALSTPRAKAIGQAPDGIGEDIAAAVRYQPSHNPSTTINAHITVR